MILSISYTIAVAYSKGESSTTVNRTSAWASAASRRHAVRHYYLSGAP
jgi:hypothetical protein